MAGRTTQRLDKILSQMGVATRSELKKMAKQGRISVNGSVTKDCSIHVDPAFDQLMVDGKSIFYSPYIYLLMNKPQGVISATEDVRDRTVIDLLTAEEQHFKPFPVGRLDKDTEGLLLLTNDGKLAHQLLSPRKHVDKTYFARLDGVVGAEEVAQFQRGVTLDDGYVTMPADLHVLASGHEIEVTIQEGKFHQVKRMFEAVGRKVEYLQRIRMGSLHLDRKLGLGEYRALSEAEVANLQAGAGKKQADIRLLALDIDGTLIKDDHTLSAKNIEAVRKVAALGVEVVLCTGRGTPNAWPIFEKLGLSGIMISHNGAATVSGEAFHIQAQLEIDQTSYVKLLHYLKQKQLYFDVNTANVLYVETVPDKVRKMYDLYEVAVTTVNDFLAINAGVVKVTLYDEDPAVLDAFESQFKADWSDDELAMVRSGDYFIDFMRPNVNKGMALKTYAEAKGLVREQVVAIGNYNNDIEMLTYAGMGIAVANATSEVKQVSDLVVASNNDDGVSEAIALLFHDERG